MENTEEERKYREAIRIIEDDLSWHQAVEDKLAKAGIDKKEMSDFINDAIDEKIDKKNKPRLIPVVAHTSWGSGGAGSANEYRYYRCGRN
jgi:hypothetical protein